MRSLLFASLMFTMTGCASFNNPEAWYSQKEYEVSDTGWRTAGTWKMKWVESDSMVSKAAPEDPLLPQGRKAVENRLSDHETEAPEASVNPDF